MSAYARGCSHEKKRSAIIQKAEKAGVFVTDDLSEALYGSSFVLSLVTPDSARDVACHAIELLDSSQVFVDLNSVSPITKKNIAQQFNNKIPFIDGAILGPVPVFGHRVPIAVAGQKADKFFEALSPFGMDITVIDAEAGAASMLKMLRSVFMKGLPQLMLEFMLPAYRLGILDAAIDSLEKTISGKTLRQLADQTFAATIKHSKRRSEEMQQVVLTLIALEESCDMSRASKKRLEKISGYAGVESVDVSCTDFGQVLRFLAENEPKRLF